MLTSPSGMNLRSEAESDLKIDVGVGEMSEKIYLGEDIGCSGSSEGTLL